MSECTIENVGVDPHWAQWIDFETETEPALAPIGKQTDAVKRQQTASDENTSMNVTQSRSHENPSRKGTESPKKSTTKKSEQPQKNRQIFESLRKHTNALLPRTEALLMAITDNKETSSGESKQQHSPSESVTETAPTARRNSRAKSIGSMFGKFRWR